MMFFILSHFHYLFWLILFLLTHTLFRFFLHSLNIIADILININDKKLQPSQPNQNSLSSSTLQNNLHYGPCLSYDNANIVEQRKQNIYYQISSYRNVKWFIILYLGWSSSSIFSSISSISIPPLSDSWWWLRSFSIYFVDYFYNVSRIGG